MGGRTFEGIAEIGGVHLAKDLGPEDLEAAVEWALTIPDVTGAVAVLGDRLAARGEVEFVEISDQWSVIGAQPRAQN